MSYDSKEIPFFIEEDESLYPEELFQDLNTRREENGMSIMDKNEIQELYQEYLKVKEFLEEFLEEFGKLLGKFVIEFGKEFFIEFGKLLGEFLPEFRYEFFIESGKLSGKFFIEFGKRLEEFLEKFRENRCRELRELLEEFLR